MPQLERPPFLHNHIQELAFVKKRFWIPVLAALLLAVLNVPLPSGAYRSGSQIPD